MAPSNRRYAPEEQFGALSGGGEHHRGGELAGMDLRPDLPRITAPTLVLAGADDPATPLPHAEAIASLVPQARLEVLGGAAHLATVQDPVAATTLLVDHLRGSP